MRMVDRLTGKPIHLDISDLPMKRGVITNPNKFILGPSGSGKSFFTNHMVRLLFQGGFTISLDSNWIVRACFYPENLQFWHKKAPKLSGA